MTSEGSSAIYTHSATRPVQPLSAYVSKYNGLPGNLTPEMGPRWEVLAFPEPRLSQEHIGCAAAVHIAVGVISACPSCAHCRTQPVLLLGIVQHTFCVHGHNLGCQPCSSCSLHHVITA